MKQFLRLKQKSRTVSRGLLGRGRLSLVWTLLLLAGCSGGRLGIQGVNDEAPELLEFNEQGDYEPYYATAKMERPRYLFRSHVTELGLTIIAGGTDERGFSGLDTLEIFDQSENERDTPAPPSLSGAWIDTNFEGDPMVFQNGPRMLFTINRLADGRILIVGGTENLTAIEINQTAEFFDPELRIFEELDSEVELVSPRIRHQSTLLTDGRLMFIGGQDQRTVTVVDPLIPEGLPGRQRQQRVFVTSKTSTVYSPKDNEFTILNIRDSENASELRSPRGRAGFAISSIAGPDLRLNSADDITILAGGFQTLSGSLAPAEKFPGAVGRGEADGQATIEMFDQQTNVWAQVSNISLASSRINDPHIMNLGQFNDFTIDGLQGMGNLILITHGNDDRLCPETPTDGDDLLVVRFTGFGPAQGAQFFRISEEQDFSHVQGIEYPLEAIGRCGTNPVALPRSMATAPNISNVATWIVAAAGLSISRTPDGCVYFTGTSVRSGTIFDPYYSLSAERVGFSTRNLSSQRSVDNPLGTIGCWLTLDGVIPTVDRAGFGDTPVNRWAQMTAPSRVWGTNTRVPGEDGILNTPDDRILLVGGGVEYDNGLSIGGEPASPSAEILIPPGAANPEPSP